MANSNAFIHAIYKYQHPVKIGHVIGGVFVVCRGFRDSGDGM